MNRIHTQLHKHSRVTDGLAYSLDHAVGASPQLSSGTMQPGIARPAWRSAPAPTCFPSGEGQLPLIGMEQQAHAAQAQPEG